MSYSIRSYGNVRFEDGKPKAIVELDCDTVSDLPEPQENWLMGSIAHVISSGDFYELDSSGEWVNQTGADEDTSASGTNAMNSPDMVNLNQEENDESILASDTDLSKTLDYPEENQKTEMLSDETLQEGGSEI